MNVAPASLDGLWQLIRAEYDGEGAPDLVVLKTVLELSRNEYRVQFDGVVSDRGSFEIAGGTGTILMHGAEGPNAGRTISGLYQRVGGVLRICYGLGGEMPGDFKTAPGQNRYLATYRRVETV